MSEDATDTFVSLVTINEPSVQNVQEMAAVWGDVRREFEEIGASVRESLAVLGQVDFLVVFEAPDADTAFQADVILERHGLAVQTMEARSTEAFAQLVEDA